ncbi:NAD(P)-binding protein [Lophium mytilinum]|uniref:NAD(P)-binding protein n=1 Tax=Lophium mytilinum TaxID=390894 RepID=A0A6A6QM58_9PEZI|nr:NAD(P)-binding protein [Lophium mytilinum]
MATTSDERRPVDMHQSPPLDLSIPYDPAWVKGRTILVTGGASGFGAAFVRKWAGHGATVIFGDINTEQGDQVARDVQKETGNKNVHFVHCDVTDWQSQVNLFKEAVKLSPHGGIDTVVANAGIAKTDTLQFPRDLSVAEPKQPKWPMLDVNLTGVMYTSHLAIFYLPRNPGSKDCNTDSDPATTPRDRHLLFLGSVASLMGLPLSPQYAASKHAVLGLFRSLRATSFAQGIRVNIVCPYYIDTPMMPTVLRVVIAGGGLGKVEDVVDAATRFTADSRVLGRGVVVGPKIKLTPDHNGELKYHGEDADVEAAAVWEVYADDFQYTDASVRAIVNTLNAVQKARGWIAWGKDCLAALAYGVGLGGKK